MEYDLFVEKNMPEPLNQKEICDYFEKYKNGDSNAREILIERNVKLVFHQVTKKFANVPYDKKELVSIGIIGLIKSVDTFDISKNTKFSSYAITCINNEVLMFLRKEKKYINTDSLDRILNIDEKGREVKIGDIIPDEKSDFVSVYENQEVDSIIRNIIEDLPPRDKEIIRLYFGFINDIQLTQRQIASKLNISKSYVSKLVRKIVKQIRFELEHQKIIDINKDKKNKNVKKGNEEMRRIQKIYEYFNEYSKEQINEMILKLNDEERNLLIRYSDDLTNPIDTKNFTKDNQDKFYGTLVPKMRRILSNLNYKIKDISKNREEQPSTNIDMSTNETQLKMNKDDYIKILELLRTPSFEQLMSILSPKEAIIISLKLGYVDGKYFSTEAISNFLGIEKEEIIEITKKILLVYKEQINSFIDTAIQITTDKSL